MSKTSAMSAETKKTVIRFGILEGIYWGIMASFGAYIASFCLSKGYEESLVSIMIAIYMTSAFAGQFFWGSMCDKLRTNKKVFLLSVMSAGIIQICMFFVPGKIGFAILYGLFGFTLGPMGSILDTWLLRSLNYDMKVYGLSRGCGSAGYAIVIFITGNMIRRFGYSTMPLLSTIFVVSTLTVAFLTADVHLEESGQRKKISTKDILSIMRIPSYLLLLAVVFFMGMANSPVNNLKIVILESVGGDVSTQGLDAFIGCMVQFLFFFISGTLTFIPAKIRMLLASLSMFLAMVFNVQATVVPVVVMASILLNIAYSLMIASSRELIYKAVEPKYHTTANGLSDASYSFISGMVSMLYAGSIAEHFGIRVMIGLSLAMAAISLTLMGISCLKKKQK